MLTTRSLKWRIRLQKIKVLSYIAKKIQPHLTDIEDTLESTRTDLHRLKFDFETQNKYIFILNERIDLLNTRINGLDDKINRKQSLHDVEF